MFSLNKSERSFAITLPPTLEVNCLRWWCGRRVGEKETGKEGERKGGKEGGRQQAGNRTNEDVIL